jgi:hypothetical protein
MAVKKPKVTEEWKSKAIAKGKGDGAPVVTELNYKTELMIALGYYNLNLDNSVRAKTALAYIKKNNKTYYEALVLAPDYEFLSLGSLITILNKGEYLSDKDKSYIDNKFTELYKKYSNVLIDKLDDDKPKAPVISIEQRIIDSARTQSENIDYAIDAWVKNKSSDFSTKAHLLSNNISGSVAKKIGEYYKNTLDEVEEALKGEDEQLNEGYSFLSKSELKKFRDFIGSIVNDCAQHQVTAKKPRIQKAKPPAVIVKRLKYLFKFDELNLKSIDPSNIVGADELWVYNTKTRKLINYTADEYETLSVKGTTIINYSIAKSQSATLRKPDEFFKDLVIGKRALSTAAKSIKTKPSQPNGRIGADMILIGAFK